MILCVGLNPCVEINFEVDSLAVGKMHKVIGRRTFFTGKALNVATGLSRLGAHAVASGFMFEENGRLYEQEMHREGVTYKFVWNSGRAKEVYNFVDRRSMLTEVVSDATPIGSENAKQLIDTVADLSKNCNAVVFSGELSDGLPEDYMYKVLSVIPPHVLKVVDTDGYRLANLLDCGLDLVKPNMEELFRATGIKITDRDSMIRACENLLERGVKRVLLSLGKHGAVICDGRQRLFCTSLNVAMNSTAGAGDAMVAAATKALCEGAELAEILRCGVAAGTASVTLPDSISFLKDKYDEVLQMLTVKEI